MGPNYTWRKNKLFCASGDGEEEAAVLEGGAMWGGPGNPKETGSHVELLKTTTHGRKYTAEDNQN